MRRACGIIVALLVAMALAAPAAAQSPADDWQGWTWSSVVERLADWAGGALSVFGASETTTTEGTGGDETAPPTDDPLVLPTDDGSETQTEAAPEWDPDG